MHVNNHMSMKTVTQPVWLADINIDWKIPRLCWILGNLRCFMASRDRWEFPSFSKSHWQPPYTTITSGNLPAVLDVQGDWERVFTFSFSFISQGPVLLLRLDAVAWILANGSAQRGCTLKWHLKKHILARFEYSFLNIPTYLNTF